MGVSNNQSKAHALAMTAIREAYEEVGLVWDTDSQDPKNG